MYQQAEQMLVDDAACLPLWFGQNYILVKPYVDGYELNPMGFAMLNKVRIEPH
jgi:oligopeptide transport system substrate-binding protein